MLESEQFKQYAQDCLRIAEKMNAKDKETLLKIAGAWEACAVEAEKKEQELGEQIDSQRKDGVNP